MSIEEQFTAAVNVIQNLPKNGSFQPSDQLKLKFYALFKQAKEGPNTTPKPSFYEIVARYKWEAWTKLGEISKEEAMKGYVSELKQVSRYFPMSLRKSVFWVSFKLESFRNQSLSLQTFKFDFVSVRFQAKR